ncbi:hypothetical protein ACKWTF_015820 [Chironomus riparius]
MPAASYCAVLGCSSTSKDKNCRFFKFPKVSKKFGDIGKLWREFTRRKNFKSLSWRFCSLHFPEDCYKPGPKGRLRLKKGSVPTIYYKNGEKVIVPYNQEYQKYYGPEAERIFEDTEKSAIDHEKELIFFRYKKLLDLKNLCRFCFMNSKDSKCIEMSALISYSIDSDDMLKAMNCETQYNSVFSEIICESCFLKIMEFEKFRKKSSQQQKEILNELEELDKKIQRVQKTQRKSNDTVPWYKVEISREPDNFQNSMIFNSTAIESIPIFNQSYISTDGEICQVMVKQEPDGDDHDVNDDFIDDMSVEDQEGADYDSDGNSGEFTLSQYISNVKMENVDEDEEDKAALNLTIKDEAQRSRTKPQKVIKSEEKGKRESYKDRTFECFFCRQKFLGKTNLRKHPCHVKHRECEVPECGKKFPNQGSYANHLIRIHGLPKICAHYCPGCKTYYQMNTFQFQDHIRSCEFNKDLPEQEIKCELCTKVCKNLENYTAHKLFHATEKLVESVDENGVKVFKKPHVQEKEKICDLCGKILSDYKNLRKHKVNVHLVDFTGNMFYCDLCPVKKPTRRLIYNHMKSVHIVNWHRCEICGKDFKSKRLLARHVLYMHERHRLQIRCHICPHKPGFNATVYLEQHMRKHHGENSAKNIERFRCDFGFCEASYSNMKTLEQHKMKAHGFYYYQ